MKKEQIMIDDEYFHMDYHPKPSDFKKDMTADEFYRWEYIERLKSLYDIEEWED